MSIKKVLLTVALLLGAVVVLSACAGPEGPAGPAGSAGPAGPAGPMPSAADLSCTQCHNDTTLIAGPATSWATSVHATGFATGYAGGRASCSGCHSGGGFADRIKAGVTNPDDFKTTYSNPTPPDCRACHNIHTTYTKDDFSLRTTAAVPLYAFTGVTYDGGLGNLCASCHQPRRPFPAATDGMVKVDSTHWGPHHGPQSAVLMGVGGALGVTGAPSAHYSTVKDTCVACHMGGEAVDHTYNPKVSACVACHADTKNFDVNGVQTTVTAKLEALKAELTKAGLLDEKGGIVVGSYPEAQAGALWNYILVSKEDKSEGVHNSKYIIALLDASLAVFGK